MLLRLETSKAGVRACVRACVCMCMRVYACECGGEEEEEGFTYDSSGDAYFGMFRGSCSLRKQGERVERFRVK